MKKREDFQKFNAALSSLRLEILRCLEPYTLPILDFLNKRLKK